MQQIPVWGTVKLKNQKLVLDALRREPLSRMDLAEQLGMTRPAVTQIVDPLLEYGLVRESSTVTTSRGRHPTLLELRPDARYAVGVNIMRGSVHVGLVNLVGEKVAQEIFPNAGTPQDVCCRIAQSIRALVEQLWLEPQRVIGIGVCAPGPLDVRAGKLLEPPNFAAWHGFAVLEELRKQFDCPIYLENVSNALALEEKSYGVAKELRDFIAIQINEGIGAGIFMHDSLYRGSHGLGAEVGHTSIRCDGKLCACGNRGCLECYASIPAILEGSGYASWAEAVDALPADDAQTLLRREAEYLAAAFVDLLNLFDPARLILLGDVVYKPDALLALLQEQLKARGVDLEGVYRDLLACGASASGFRAAAVVCLRHYFEDLALPLA